MMIGTNAGSRRWAFGCRRIVQIACSAVLLLAIIVGCNSPSPPPFFGSSDPNDPGSFGTIPMPPLQGGQSILPLDGPIITDEPVPLASIDVTGITVTTLTGGPTTS